MSRFPPDSPVRSPKSASAGPSQKSWGTLSGRIVLNAMFVFVPIAIVGDWLGLGGIFVFTCAALACIPMSYWLGQSTESLAGRLGPVSGGLLNATFGNAPELIISILALSHGLFIVVRTALIGSILGQLLLVLGTSLLLAGIRHRRLRFSQDLVQANFTLMVIALVAIGLPAILAARMPESTHANLGFLIVVLSVFQLIIYGFAMLFALQNQPSEDDSHGGPQWSPVKALVVLGVSSGGMVLLSELLVGSILSFMEQTGISQVFIGLILIPIFGNVVDHIVAVTVALKNRMDLSLTISVGSAAQIASMILPIILLVGLATAQPAALVFTPIELISLAIGLALMIPVLLDGSSNWLEGAELLASYSVLAAVLWVL